MDKRYDPTITITDIEVWMNCSHRSAVRLMGRMKADLELPKYIRPVRSVARRYFGLDN